MNFELQTTDTTTKARAGRITTDHGVIETPIFMPVGTVASVKGVQQRELTEDINADISLCIGIEIFSPIVEGIKYILFPVLER